MVGGDLAAVDGKPESSRTDVEQSGGIRQVHPRLLWQIVGLITSNAMMAAQRGNPLSCPTVAAPGKLTITVQNAGDEIVTANASQNGNGFYQLARCLRAALATTPARHPQFCMCAALPVQGENKFSCRAIHVNEYFLDQRANDALLQPYTGGWIGPDGFQLLGELVQILQGRCWTGSDDTAVLLDAHFDLTHLLQGLVPAALQLCRDQAVLRIRGIVLPMRTVGAIAGGLKIALQSFQNVVPLPGAFFTGPARKLR